MIAESRGNQMKGLRKNHMYEKFPGVLHVSTAFDSFYSAEERTRIQKWHVVDFQTNLDSILSIMIIVSMFGGIVENAHH